MNVLRRSARRRAAERLRRSASRLLVLAVGLVVALPVLGAVTASPATAAAEDGKLRILLFYKPNFHASQAEARVAIKELAANLATEYSQTLEIQETDNPVVFTPENLATTDGVVFAQTGGVLFNAAQRSALEAYIRGGGGYAGLHYAGWSVGNSEHDENPFYLRLVGAMSEGHPENPGVRPGTVNVAATGHPLTAGLPASFSRNDEWYDWTVNPAPNVRTLVTADESSYGSLGRQGTTHPITWCQEIDNGRSWYTGMGHEGTAYSEPNIRTQLKNGIAYAAGLLPADCSPPKKDVQGGWSGVTPWPLMPINMSLTSEGKVQSFGSVSTAGCTDNTPYDFTGNSCVVQGGQMEIDVWDPSQARTLENLRTGIVQNNTYTDLFCSMQVQNPHTGAVMTVGGDDGLGGNDPNDAAIGVTSYTTNQGLRNEAPMNFPRWYPTGTTTPDGSIVVQGGTSRGGPGGPGVLTPEIYTPDSGNGWKVLTGATSGAAYGDGGADHAGEDENRWWYPRAFVAPGSGTIFNISGTQMFELDPSGDGTMTLRGTLPTAVSNQGALGRPVGATSTATMYRPGKILQTGGGAWANGGGPAGARGAFTVDITGGTANPVVTATDPMKFQRHWATSTVLPDGDVLVTGGSRDNNGDGGYVTNPEIWDPETGDWTTIEVPAEHARLYHSSALLLPDGRIMIGGGGAPGPRNYTDVEYYSPSYLFDGDEPAARPAITSAPGKIGYDGTFQVAASDTVSRVTLVRNGSVTHGFNNDQNFQDLEFTQAGGNGPLTITAPEDGTYAPPGTYMLFVFDADGTPSVAKMLDIDPSVAMDQRTPQVVDQFEYPRLPADWRGGNPAQTVDVAAGNARMAPWTVQSQVQLVRAANGSQGGLGAQGYHLALGQAGSLERRLTGLEAGREYRVSLRYARDSRSAGTGPGTAQLEVGDLDATLTATTANPSQSTKVGTFATYVGTFTASARSEVLSLASPGSGASLVVDDLVVIGSDPGVGDVPIHYEFEEGEGTTVANTGTDDSVGAATLTGTTGWSPNGVLGKALNMPGGTNANTVDLPDNLLQDEADFTTAFWVRPDTKGNWINLFHLGDGLGDAGSFFQIQMQTQAQGNTGLAATFKKKGNNLQERVYATPTKDVTANKWNHVAFTRQGTTGTLYLNGVEIASRNNLTLTMTDVGPTTNNWIGRNGYPDPAFDGLVDDVRLYTSALSADDLDALYDEGSALRTTTTVTTSPVSPSPFAEPVTVSTTVKDESDGNASGVAELRVDGAAVGEPVTVTDGVATFPALPLTRGEHAIEVRFVAADGWRDSAGTATHTVERPPPGSGVGVRYAFNESTGTTSPNLGNDQAIGAATLQGSTSWSAQGRFGRGVSLPGGASTTNSHVKLPDNIQAGLEDEFSISVWTRPNALPQWVPLVQIGSSTDTFFLLQSNTNAAGATGFAATFKKAGAAAQERLTLGGGNDLPLNEWTHVVYTHSGTTGRIYFNGQLKGTRTDFTLDMGDVGVGGTTTANMIGGTSWPDPRWNGLVDEFQLFDYELTTEQIQTLGTGPANTAPTGVADAFTTGEDTPLTVPAPGVLGNDTDDEGNTLTATNGTQPAHGSVTLAANGSFTYTPDAGFHGTDSFTYAASDGTTASAATTVTLTVTKAPNTAPEASDDAYTTDEGDPLTVAAPGVLANDSDEDGDDLTATDATQPDHGTVELGTSGAFTYTPDPGFHGTDTFTYVATDGEDDSEPATVTITVEQGPEATTVSGTAATTTYGRAGSVQVKVTPATAGGRVELLNGSKVLGAGTLAAGRATIALPAKSLAPGSHRLTVRYVGNATHQASTGAVVVRVAKATPTMKVTAPKSVKRGSRPTMKVTLSATGGVPLTGKVTAKVGGKTVSGTVRGGKVTLRLAKATKAGTLKVTVTYAGSALANKAVKTVRIKVRR